MLYFAIKKGNKYIQRIRTVIMHYISPCGYSVQVKVLSGKKRTTELMGQLIKATNIKHFIEKNLSCMESEPFHEYIRRKCLETGVVQEHVIKRAETERTYGHQLFRGLRTPSRDKVIQLAFGFRFDVE